MKNTCLFILTVLVCTSCTPSSPKIPGFKSHAWIQDKYGCNSERLSMATALVSYQKNLYGYSEQDILQLLGKADEQELYKRNQKFLRYFLEPNEKCRQPEKESLQKKPSMLQVRLNATGKVNELFILH